MKWYVIINPASGKGKGIHFWKKIEPLLCSAGIDFTNVFSEYHLHSVALTHEGLRNGFRNIIAVGGDGTVNEVVNGIFSQPYMASSDVTFASIPLGTGNDWIRNASVPNDFAKAIELIKENKTISQDVGLISCYEKDELRKRYFIVLAGMGFDSLVVEKTKYNKGNKITYLIGILKSLFSYQSAKVKIKIQNQIHEYEVLMCIGSIGKYCGGGMRITPDAIMDDGLFDIGVLEKMNVPEILWNLRRLYDGTIINHPKMHVFRAGSFSVSSDKKLFIEADGELLGHTPAEYQLLPKALRIISGLG